MLGGRYQARGATAELALHRNPINYVVAGKAGRSRSHVEFLGGIIGPALPLCFE